MLYLCYLCIICILIISIIIKIAQIEATSFWSEAEKLVQIAGLAPK